MRRMVVALTVVLLILAPALGAMAQAEKPITIRVVIGKGDVIAPTNFDVPRGALVRLMIVNRSDKEHGLVSNQTKDVVYTPAGQTKVLEFRVTALPVTFACTLPGHTEKLEIRERGNISR